MRFSIYRYDPDKDGAVGAVGRPTCTYLIFLPPELMMLPPHARKRAQPSWFSPMLATLVREAFSSDDWMFEAKLDGVRCLVFRNGRQVRLVFRNRKLLNDTYPELVAPFAAQKPQRYIADGEIVAFKGRITSFSKLQRRMQVRDAEEARRRGVKVFCYLFDLLYLNGYDLRRMPLDSRKRLLEESFHFRDPLRYSEHRAREGEAYYREACRKGLEGVIAKRASSTYVSRRSRDWLKFKCSVGSCGSGRHESIRIRSSRTR